MARRVHRGGAGFFELAAAGSMAANQAGKPRASQGPALFGFMRKINVADLPEETWTSPKGKFGMADKLISIALGRKENSTDLRERHPFDLEICRVPAGLKMCPYHSHSEQWEFYLVISGRGTVRHAEGQTEIGPGDSFIFKPGEAHQLSSGPGEDLVFYIVADNPLGESCHYPDSGKWSVRSPVRRMLRSENLDYFDGEE
jgi:uncharacterized cupin superfamily protein